MIRKTITLLKKDIMLLENYSLLAVIILVVFPLFLNYSIKDIMEPTYFLFLSLDFCAFLVFSQIYTMESKYKGMTYLMACPFKRSQMIIARYVLLFIILSVGAGCYKILELINPGQLFSMNTSISTTQVIVSMSIVWIAYDVLIPILNNRTYEKIRVVHALLSVIIPLWGVILVRYLLEQFQINVTIKELSNFGVCILLLIDVVLTLISIKINKKLWEKKEF